MGGMLQWVMGIAVLLVILFVGIKILGLLVILTWNLLVLIVLLLAIVFVVSLIAHFIGKR